MFREIFFRCAAKSLNTLESISKQDFFYHFGSILELRQTLLAKLKCRDRRHAKLKSTCGPQIGFIGQEIHHAGRI